ncbi:unnamed protein product [Lymnaea stagnalis]|uniref:C1q domain-containing protein n=1 Tax=Lymnaea stagnalis TaxID=6523 RepID=A0AAV2HZ74_LYMST
MWLPAVLACACLALSSTSALRHRRDDSDAKKPLNIRAYPKVAVETITEVLKLECRAPEYENVLIPVLIYVGKTGNETKQIAIQKITGQESIEDDRIKSEGTLQVTDGVLPRLNISITKPVVDDGGVYICKYVYVDTTFQAHVITGQLDVTVTPPPSKDFIPLPETEDCNCQDVWDEIAKIKATLVKENKELRSQVHSYDETCRVSFSAKFATRNGYSIVGGEPAIFDSVLSNKGEAYDVNSGEFTAPCNGQYFFQVTLRSHQEQDSGYVDGVIQVDGEERARTSVFTDASNDNYQSATNGVVLALEKGQKVNVQVKSTSSGEFVGDAYSIFSGFYLYP